LRHSLVIAAMASSIP